MDNSNSVLVIDDHDIIRFGLEALVSGSPHLKLAGSAATLEDGLEAIARLKPALVLADLSLTDSKGLDTVRQVVEAQAGRATLIVSMHDEAIYGEQVLALGAQGYLMKERAHALVIPAALAVLRGETWISPTLNARLIKQMMRRSRGPGAAAPAGDTQPLSQRELEVLELLAQGKTTKEIAFELDLSVRTVDVHRASMKKKLGFRSGAQLVAFALSRR